MEEAISDVSSKRRGRGEVESRMEKPISDVSSKKRGRPVGSTGTPYRSPDDFLGNYTAHGERILDIPAIRSKKPTPMMVVKSIPLKVQREKLHLEKPKAKSAKRKIVKGTRRLPGGTAK